MAKRRLSIFIDESGDFGEYQKHSPFYIVTMVLHDQDLNIRNQIEVFYDYLGNLGYKKHAIHAGPLIRRESVYSNLKIEQRKKLFNSLFNFVRKLDINYDFVLIDKKNYQDVIQFTAQLSKLLAKRLQEDSEFWKKYDEIVIYYDNGQIELTKILTSVFNALYENVEFRKVSPCDYVLFQAADLICTLLLTNEKFDRNEASNSEKEFFKNQRDFKKNYIKSIVKKHIKNI